MRCKIVVATEFAQFACHILGRELLCGLALSAKEHEPFCPAAIRQEPSFDGGDADDLPCLHHRRNDAIHSIRIARQSGPGGKPTGNLIRAKRVPLTENITHQRGQFGFT